MSTRRSPASPLSAAIALLALLLSLLAAAPANAAVPTNDDPSTAIVVTEAPYTNSQNTAEATSGALDTCGVATVWYEFTPSTTGTYQVDTFGSSFDTTLAAYEGAPPSGPSLGCVDDTFGLQSGLWLHLTAGVSYLFEAGTCCGVAPEQVGPGGDLTFNIAAFEPFSFTYTVDSLQLTSVPGVSTISGSVTCSTPGFVQIDLSARQRQGRVIASGLSNSFVDCSPTTTTWSATLDTSPRVLTGAGVNVTANAFGCDYNFITCHGGEAINASLKPRRQ